MSSRMMGAVALLAAFVSTNALAADTVVPQGDVDTLRSLLANASAGDIIRLAGGTYDLSKMTSGAMSTESFLKPKSTDVTILGLSDSPDGTIVTGGEGNTTRRIFELTSGSIVSNLTVTGGVKQNGGGINGGVAYDCVITGNAGGNGGGVNGTRLYGCVVSNNTGGTGGGGYNCAVVKDCVFSGNQATDGYAESGSGALHVPGSTTISGCVFTNNTCAYAACMNVKCGAGATVLITNCVFSCNNSTHSGVIYRRSGSNYKYYCNLSILDCTFARNIASSGNASGSSITIESTNSVIRSCLFVTNTCNGTGGAVLGGRYYGCHFIGNTAKKSGGAADSAGLLKDCSFVGNKGLIAGAVLSCNSISNCVFVGNSATEGYAESGGGAVVFNGPAVVSGCAFTNNTSSGYYGCIRVDSAASPTLVTNCTFFGNSGRYSGSAIGRRGSPVINVIGCAFVSNVNCSAVNLGAGSLVNSTFIGNRAAVAGSAAAVAVPVVGCTFVGNAVMNASGGCVNLSAGASVSDSTFIDNVCETWNYGGALYYGGKTFPSVSNCVFSGRNRTESGRGHAAHGVRLYSCTFVNCTNTSGYVIANCNMYNCFVTNNVNNDSTFDYKNTDITQLGAYTNVGCVFASNISKSALLSESKVQINCTYVDNVRSTATSGGAVGTGCLLVNCLFVDNKNGSTYQDMGSGFTARNCSFSAVGIPMAQVAGAVDCRMVSRDRVRFTDDDEAYSLLRNSKVRRWALLNDDIRTALGETDIYGCPRYEGSTLDVGAAQCHVPAPGMMMLVR